MITDNSFDVLCLTKTWLKTNDYFGLNESTPPSYCYKHEPRQTGRGGGVAIIYSDIQEIADIELMFELICMFVFVFLSFYHHYKLSEKRKPTIKQEKVQNYYYTI